MNCDDLSREWRRFELRFPAGPEKYELYALLDRLKLSRHELALIVMGLRVRHGFKLSDFGTEVSADPFEMAPLSVWMETLKGRDAELERLWAEFGDVPMNPETECMDEPFLGFPAGTHREDIWHWFDERHSRGVAYLLHGAQKIVKKCFVVIDSSYDVGLSTYAFWSREEAEQNIRESIANVIADLKDRDSVEVLEQGDSFSVYVPDTGISYDWTISETEIR